MEEKEEIIIKLFPEKEELQKVVDKLCEKVKEINALNNKIDEQKNKYDNLLKEFDDYKNYVNNELQKIKTDNEKKIQEIETIFNEKLTEKENIINNIKNKNNELENLIKKESENLKYNIEYNNGVHITPDEIIQYKEKLANFKKIIDTNIMRYNELYIIETGVKEKLKKKIKKCNLLFRASEHGYGAKDFHYKCDGRKNTVTLVETTAGKRFGGFTDVGWDSETNNYKNSNNGFIFSLDDKAIYYMKNNYIIYSHSNCGPTFGNGHDFYICDNCNIKNDNCNASDNAYNTNEKKCAMAGTYKFLVKDYEVYQLEFE